MPKDQRDETTHGVEGGQVSGIQLADNVQREGRAEEAESRAPKVTTAQGGSKRGGFFKKRDYE